MKRIIAIVSLSLLLSSNVLAASGDTNIPATARSASVWGSLKTNFVKTLGLSYYVALGGVATLDLQGPAYMIPGTSTPVSYSKAWALSSFLINFYARFNTVSNVAKDPNDAAREQDRYAAEYAVYALAMGATYGAIMMTGSSALPIIAVGLGVMTACSGDNSPFDWARDGISYSFDTVRGVK